MKREKRLLLSDDIVDKVLTIVHVEKRPGAMAEECGLLLHSLSSLTVIMKRVKYLRGLLTLG